MSFFLTQSRRGVQQQCRRHLTKSLSIIPNNHTNSNNNNNNNNILLSKLHAVSKRSISSSKLTIEKTTDTSRFENKPKNDDLQFGHTISDHMLIVEWNQKDQWTAPKIVPYQDLKISPAATCLNYGTCRKYP